MAGFWHLSHHQLRDPDGAVYAGAKANFYESDGLTRITVYQDYGLGTAHANPVEANSTGVFPPVFFDEDDDFYRQRITTADGVIIPGTDVGTLPIIGPSGGGGGSEVPVDENALIKTGDFLWSPKSGTRSGFVRANGRTIGSATSGATERANADCENLFLDMWATYTNTFCAVTGGRGVSAAADWAANKPIAMLDMRNKSASGLDDMGNSAASGFSGVTFSVGDATTAASQGGAARHTLSSSEMPSHTHTVTDPGHTHALSNGGTQVYANTSGSQGGSLSGAHTETLQSATTGITNQNTGGGGSHNNMPPFMLGTWYVKL